MDYKVKIQDDETKKEYETFVKVRSDATIKRVVLKAVEQVADKLSSDEVDFKREVNCLYREAYDEEEFMEQLKMDLDLLITVEEN